MFESEGWEGSDSEAGDSDGEGDNDPWNLEAMRRETERLRQLKEEDRLARLEGGGSDGLTNGESSSAGLGESTNGDQSDPDSPVRNGDG